MSRYSKQIQDDDLHKAWISERIKKLQWAQSLPLERKIAMTEWRISEAVDRFGFKAVAVSYSTGKDSDVLSHIIRQLYPDLLHIFANTTCEYRESLQHYRRQRERFNLIMSLPKPEWNFNRVVEEYGYPMLSKDISRNNRAYRNAKSEKTRNTILNYMQRHMSKYIKYLNVKLSDKCCEILKHGQIEKLEKQLGIECSIIATTAEESQLRQFNWVNYGCNVFEHTKNPRSRPMSFWTEKDVWDYIKYYNLEISEVYTKHGYRRNGCMFCGFGVHLEKSPNRIQLLQKTHPSSHEYLVRNFGDIFKECGINIWYQPTLLDFISQEVQK